MPACAVGVAGTRRGSPREGGLPKQAEASETLKIYKGQLSQWENESPRQLLENLGPVGGYGATVADLPAVLLGGESVSKSGAEERGRL
jgi:hypothetical protein